MLGDRFFGIMTAIENFSASYPTPGLRLHRTFVSRPDTAPAMVQSQRAVDVRHVAVAYLPSVHDAADNVPEYG